MPLYGFAYTKAALAFLQTIPKKLAGQIRTKIESLAENPHPPTACMVREKSTDDEVVFRIRSGVYRVLYVVRGYQIVILDIDHRKDVYR